MEIDELIKRLLTEEPTGFVRVDEERDVRYQTLPGGQMIRSLTAVKSEVLKKLRNPDGPEAATALEALRAERDALREALQNLSSRAPEHDYGCGIGPHYNCVCYLQDAQIEARKALGD